MRFQTFHCYYLCVQLTVAVFAMCLVGCGENDGRATVRGTVTFANEPVERGTISLIPAQDTKGPTAGANIAMGKYTIAENGPVPGTYKMVIEAYRETGKMIQTEALGEIVEVEETEQYIPAKYNTNTELLIEIDAGRNDHDFAL